MDISNKITWVDFEKVELRSGTITDVKDFPEARKPAYIITVDFGKEIGIKKSSAQITDLYTKEELLNKQIIGVINFPPKQIGPIYFRIFNHRVNSGKRKCSISCARYECKEWAKVRIRIL